MTGITETSVDFNVNDNSRSLSALLERIQPVFEVPVSGSLTIDLTECQYLGPDAAAVLYSAWLEAQRLDQHAAIRLPKSPRQLLIEISQEQHGCRDKQPRQDHLPEEWKSQHLFGRWFGGHPAWRKP